MPGESVTRTPAQIAEAAQMLPCTGRSSGGGKCPSENILLWHDLPMHAYSFGMCYNHVTTACHQALLLDFYHYVITDYSHCQHHSSRPAGAG